MNRIRQLREQNNMTQKELGKLLDLQDAVISKYEHESIPLTDILIRNICSIFKVSADYLLNLDDISYSSNSSNISVKNDNGIPLNSDEILLINTYRKLSNPAKADCLKYLEFSLVKEQASQKTKIT